MVKQLAGIFVITLMLLCSPTKPPEVAGGSTDTETGAVGKVVNESGRAAAGIPVKLYPSDYHPLWDTLPDSLCDTTDEEGQYRIPLPDTGTYNLYVSDSVNGFIITGIAARDSLRYRRTVDTLRVPGTIKASLPFSRDSAGGYLYIPGTPLAYSLDTVSMFQNAIALKDVPDGDDLALRYADTVLDSVLAESVRIKTDSVSSVGSYAGWFFSRPLYMNTSKTGAGVSQDVTGFPVLIRLRNSDFNFNEADSAGADIRFTNAAGTPLAYEIEKWDTARSSADIWVNVDTVKGNNSKQYIRMFWKNEDAGSSANSEMVFDTSNAFSGVWHLKEISTGVPDEFKDATAFRHHGRGGYKRDDFRPVRKETVIGFGQGFDGINDHIEVVPPDSDASLAPPENMTISAWVMPKEIQATNSILHAYASSYSMVIVLYKLYGQWTNDDSLKYLVSNESTIAAGKWHHIAIQKEDNELRLFINSNRVHTTSATSVSGKVRGVKQDMYIGASDGNGDMVTDAFNGKIDEVRISRTARSAAWIKLSYENQKENGSLVEFR